MDNELWAALLGGLLGILGSLLSVALGFYAQKVFSKQQLEAERELHKEQLEHERALHKEQLEAAREHYRNSIERDNKIRVLDMIRNDVAIIRDILKDPKAPFEDKERANRTMTQFQNEREKLMRELGIPVLRLPM